MAAVEEGGAESLAVAGGDGSVAAVAGVAMECDLPLVVVPTGTLNHFARDLGLDLTRRSAHSRRSTPAMRSGAWTSGASADACSSITSL